MPNTPIFPKSIFVPIPLIFSNALRAPVLRTWMQLRSLANGKQKTTLFQVKSFARMVSKSPSTIYGHMALLKTFGVLQWRTADKGTLVVSFPPFKPGIFPVFQDSGILEDASLFIKDDKYKHLIKRESPFLDSKKLEKLADKPGNGPVGIYRSLTKVKPNQVQRKSMLEVVTDCEMWYSTIEHWLQHKWSSVNIPGMLELYQRGGPEGCRYCQNDAKNSTREVIEEMREECTTHGNA